jgi:hypothetical protein
MDPTKDSPEGDLTDLELRLRQWQPTSFGLDRDRMLFEAGRASARAEIWGGVPLGSIAALAIVAIGLGVLFVRERGERQALEVRIVEHSTAPKTPEMPIEPAPALAPIVERPPAPDSYLVLTRNMLSAGPEIMPSPAPDTTSVVPATNDEPPLRVRGSGSLINF